MCFCLGEIGPLKQVFTVNICFIEVENLSQHHRLLLQLTWESLLDICFRPFRFLSPALSALETTARPETTEPARTAWKRMAPAAFADLGEGARTQTMPSPHTLPGVVSLEP